jgi:TRAP-type C4-dicarboxylate transport system permease small subunit
LFQRFGAVLALPLFVAAILFVILLLYNAMAGRWSAMDPLSVLSDASNSDSEEEEEEEEEDNDDAKQPGSPIHEVACKFFSIFVCITVVIVFWRYLLRYVITPRELVSHLYFGRL